MHKDFESHDDSNIMKTIANATISIYKMLVSLHLIFKMSKKHVKVKIRQDELHILHVDNGLVFIRGLKNGRLKLAILKDGDLWVYEI